MEHRKKDGFTLVELIVVITILAILGTIAFLSFQGYSKSSRDSVRVADLNSIKTSLELFSIQTGYYPEPSNSVRITYSGAVVWEQGSVGDSVVLNLQRLNKNPADPLTGSEYTYSRLNTKKEYELATVLEDGNITGISQVQAGNQIGYSYIDGNFNGIVAQVLTGSQLYILAVPSIIGSDVTLYKYEDILLNNALVISGANNIPVSYDNTVFKNINSLDEGIVDPLIYNSGSTLSIINGDDLKAFTRELQNVYSGSIFADQGVYLDIINSDLNSSSDFIYLVGSIINNSLGGKILINDIAENYVDYMSNTNYALECPTDGSVQVGYHCSGGIVIAIGYDEGDGTIGNTGKYYLVSAIADEGNYKYAVSNSYYMTNGNEHDGYNGTYARIIEQSYMDNYIAPWECINKNEYGYTDWYMPSVSELTILYCNSTNIFTNNTSFPSRDPGCTIYNRNTVVENLVTTPYWSTSKVAMPSYGVNCISGGTGKDDWAGTERCEVGSVKTLRCIRRFN